MNAYPVKIPLFCYKWFLTLFYVYIDVGGLSGTGAPQLVGSHLPPIRLAVVVCREINGNAHWDIDNISGL